MKLKLSNHEGIQVLTVSEDLPTAELSVLRAGILKILNAPDSKGLVLDLRLIQASSEAVRALRADTAAIPGSLRIVAQTGGDEASIQEAINRLNSPTQKLLRQESILLQRLKLAKLRQTELEANLSSHSADWPELLKLKNRRSSLCRETKTLEQLLESFVSAGQLEAATPRPKPPRMTLMDQILKTVLAKQGILKEIS